MVLRIKLEQVHLCISESFLTTSDSTTPNDMNSQDLTIGLIRATRGTAGESAGSFVLIRSRNDSGL